MARGVKPTPGGAERATAAIAAGAAGPGAGDSSADRRRGPSRMGLPERRGTARGAGTGLGRVAAAARGAAVLPAAGRLAARAPHVGAGPVAAGHMWRHDVVLLRVARAAAG